MNAPAPMTADNRALVEAAHRGLPAPGPVPGAVEEQEGPRVAA